MASSTVVELKDGLRDALDRNGSLREIKARLRAEIYKSLNESNVIPTPELSDENLIINELIREYLLYNGYRETLSVFMPETGQPSVRPFDRSFLAEHLQVVDGPNSQRVPLLYNLVTSSQQRPTSNPSPQPAAATAPSKGTQ